MSAPTAMKLSSELWLSDQPRPPRPVSTVVGMPIRPLPSARIQALQAWLRPSPSKRRASRVVAARRGARPRLT